eukprot:gene4738-8654_t
MLDCHTLLFILLLTCHATNCLLIIHENDYGSLNVVTSNSSHPIWVNGIELMSLLKTTNKTGVLLNPYPNNSNSVNFTILAEDSHGSMCIISFNKHCPIRINGLDVIQMLHKADSSIPTFQLSKNLSYIEASDDGAIEIYSRNVTHLLIVNGEDVIALICSQMKCATGQYRQRCDGSNLGSCIPCSTCTDGMYLVGCHGLRAGICVPCEACAPGYERLGCGGLDIGVCTECQIGYESDIRKFCISSATLSS